VRVLRGPAGAGPGAGRRARAGGRGPEGAGRRVRTGWRVWTGWRMRVLGGRRGGGCGPAGAGRTWPRAVDDATGAQRSLQQCCGHRGATRVPQERTRRRSAAGVWPRCRRRCRRVPPTRRRDAAGVWPWCRRGAAWRRWNSGCGVRGAATRGRRHPAGLRQHCGRIVPTTLGGMPEAGPFTRRPGSAVDRHAARDRRTSNRRRSEELTLGAGRTA
jgi:hypothetical protein